MKTKTSAERVATGGVLTALALIFSYIEFLVPIPLPIPGIKLGLANLVVLITIYKLGASYALCINIARILLAGLLFGNAFSVIYALCGGLVSLALMLLLKKSSAFSVIGVSMAGGVAHNLAQLVVASLVMQTKEVFLYFPLLCLSGIATGIIIGIIATLILRAIDSNTEK